MNGFSQNPENMPQAIEGAKLNIREGTSVEKLQFLSIRHLQSADFFNNKLLVIEALHHKDPPQELIKEQAAYAISSIFIVVAFIETAINEVFLDALDVQIGRPAEIVKSLPQEVVESMAQIWNEKRARNWHGFETLINLLISSLTSNDKGKYQRGVDYWPILDKYQLALYLAKKRLFDKNSRCSRWWRDFNTLIELRNTLVHYKRVRRTTAHGGTTVSVDERNDDSVTNQKVLEEKLINIGFRPNLLLPKEPFPDKYLGWGCARWAIRSSLGFTNEFFKRIGESPQYKHILCDLSIGKRYP